MMKKTCTIALAASVMISTAAFAQQDGQMISLEEAIAVTLTENPALKAAAYEERAAQQQRQGQRQHPYLFQP